MQQEWTENQIRSYIDTLNAFVWGYSEDDQRKIQNEWKDMLWLEKHGFNFSSTTFHLSIDNHFHIYDEQDGSEIYFSQVTDWEERRMIFHVRNRMRQILGLPLLGEADFDQMLSDVIGSEYRSKALDLKEADEMRKVEYSYDPERYTIADIARDAEEIENWISAISPNSIEVFKELSKFTLGQVAEEFCDLYTGNGSYVYYAKESFQNICIILFYKLVNYKFNVNYPELYYGNREKFFNSFLQILYNKYK